jgi:catechol 2,3-dioxygenase-like lactoylglutathione lyase family enzyme
MYIAFTSIYVNDVDRAKDFYVNKLGFEEESDTPMEDGTRWVSLVPPGAQTNLVLNKGFPDWSPDKVGGPSRCALEVDDVFETHKQWKAKGVEFLDEPSAEFYGGWARFKDSEGNEWGLHSPAREAASAA